MAIEVRFRIFKDPASAWIHFLGFLVALIASFVLVWRAADHGPKALGMAVYGASLLAVFLSSSLYHWLDLGHRGNRWLRRFDHAAIFLLIAGTTVPPLLHHMDGPWRVGLLALVGALAIGLAIVKMIWIECPEWVGLTLYFGLVGVITVPASLILPQLSWGGAAWLLGGGAAYLAGAVVYAREWPDPWPDQFGHHEIWHVFVVLGASAHYSFNYSLLAAPIPPF